MVPSVSYQHEKSVASINGLKASNEENESGIWISHFLCQPSISSKSWTWYLQLSYRPPPLWGAFNIKVPSSKKCQKSSQKRAQKSKLLFWVAQKSILLKKVLKKVNSLFWVLKIVLFKVTFIKYCSKKSSKKLLSQKSTQKRAFMSEFPQKRALKSESLKKVN